MKMDKLTVLIFPAITFAIITTGVIAYEIVKYINGLF